MRSHAERGGGVGGIGALGTEQVRDGRRREREPQERLELGTRVGTERTRGDLRGVREEPDEGTRREGVGPFERPGSLESLLAVVGSAQHRRQIVHEERVRPDPRPPAAMGGSASAPCTTAVNQRPPSP